MPIKNDYQVKYTIHKKEQLAGFTDDDNSVQFWGLLSLFDL